MESQVGSRFPKSGEVSRYLHERAMESLHGFRQPREVATWLTADGRKVHRGAVVCTCCGVGVVYEILLWFFLFSFSCCIHYLLFLVFRIRLHLFMSLQIRKRRVNGTMRRWARRGCLFAYGIVESPGLYFIRSNYHNLYGID